MSIMPFQAALWIELLAAGLGGLQGALFAAGERHRLAPSTTLAANTGTVMLGDRGRTFLAVPVGRGQAYCSAAMTA